MTAITGMELLAAWASGNAKIDTPHAARLAAELIEMHERLQNDLGELGLLLRMARLQVNDLEHELSGFRAAALKERQ